MPIKKSLTSTIRILRANAEGARAQGKVSYPESLRKEIVACLVVMRTEGVSWDQCNKALGICKATLHTWHRAASEPSASTAMVPVKILNEKAAASSRPSSTLRLIAPSGHELTGFDLAEAAQILRALS